MERHCLQFCVRQHCVWMWVCMWSHGILDGMDVDASNGRQLEGNGKQWKAMESNGRQLWNWNAIIKHQTTSGVRLRLKTAKTNFSYISNQIWEQTVANHWEQLRTIAVLGQQCSTQSPILAIRSPKVDSLLISSLMKLPKAENISRKAVHSIISMDNYSTLGYWKTCRSSRYLCHPMIKVKAVPKLLPFNRILLETQLIYLTFDNHSVNQSINETEYYHGNMWGWS